MGVPFTSTPPLSVSSMICALGGALAKGVTGEAMAVSTGTVGDGVGVIEGVRLGVGVMVGVGVGVRVGVGLGVKVAVREGMNGAVGKADRDDVGVCVGRSVGGMPAELTARTGVTLGPGVTDSTADSGQECRVSRIPAVKIANSAVSARLLRPLRRERCRRIKKDARRESRKCLSVESNATAVSSPVTATSQGIMKLIDYLIPFMNPYAYAPHTAEFSIPFPGGHTSK